MIEQIKYLPAFSRRSCLGRLFCSTRPAFARAALGGGSGLPGQGRCRGALFGFAFESGGGGTRAFSRRFGFRGTLGGILLSLTAGGLRGFRGIGRGQLNPARRALDRPMAIACLGERALCLPSRTCSISSRTNSPAWVEGAFPSAASRRARRKVSCSGMFIPRGKRVIGRDGGVMWRVIGHLF
jgi:hypothetical protein